MRKLGIQRLDSSIEVMLLRKEPQDWSLSLWTAVYVPGSRPQHHLSWKTPTITSFTAPPLQSSSASGSYHLKAVGMAALEFMLYTQHYWDKFPNAYFWSSHVHAQKPYWLFIFHRIKPMWLGSANICRILIAYQILLGGDFTQGTHF